MRQMLREGTGPRPDMHARVCWKHRHAQTAWPSACPRRLLGARRGWGSTSHVWRVRFGCLNFMGELGRFPLHRGFRFRGRRDTFPRPSTDVLPGAPLRPGQALLAQGPVQISWQARLCSEVKYRRPGRRNTSARSGSGFLAERFDARRVFSRIRLRLRVVHAAVRPARDRKP